MSTRARMARTRRHRRVDSLRVRNFGKANDGTRYHRKIGGRSGRIRSARVKNKAKR